MGRRRKFDLVKKTKWCNKCSKDLPFDAFGDNRRTASGKQDYCKTCHNAYTGSFWAKVASFEQLLEQKWRMTPSDYLELWRTQDKRCLICGTALTLYHRDTHIHAFGDQKRLLCTTCNRGMECFKDNSGLLRKALEQVNESDKEPIEGVDVSPKQEEDEDSLSGDDNSEKDDQQRS
jgi:Recombination endonuclease VII